MLSHQTVLAPFSVRICGVYGNGGRVVVVNLSHILFVKINPGLVCISIGACTSTFGDFGNHVHSLIAGKVRRKKRVNASDDD